MVRDRVMVRNKREIVKRLEMVVDALGLMNAEIDIALDSEQDLIEFCQRYNQDLDWVIQGDAKSMIVERAVNAGNPTVVRRELFDLARAKARSGFRAV